MATLRLNKKMPQETMEKRLVEILKKPHALKKERLMIWGLLVTPADVQAVAKKYLHPEKMTLVAAGPIDEQGKPLKKAKD